MRKCVFSVLLLLVMGCSERLEQQFATGEEARSSSLSAEGWVPGWLPATSREVRILYDPDSNEVWIRCELPEADRAEVLGDLKPIPWAQARVVPFPPAGKPWWPYDELDERSGPAGQLFSGDNRTILLEHESERVFIHRWAR